MCDCINVEVGSYSNQLEIPAPKHLIEWAEKVNFSLGGDKKTVCVDRCLVDEIKYLWSLGITTTGCCCGHNKVESYIGVEEKDIPRMKQLGYNVQFNPCRPNDDDSFTPKSINNKIKHQ